MRRPVNCLQYGLWLLSKKDYSEGDIRLKMSKYFDETTIEKSIEFLKKRSFIDDRRFAQKFVDNQINFRSYGKKLIKLKLIQHRVEKEVAEEILTKLDTQSEFGRAIELANHWLKKKSDIERVKLYNKLGNYLASKGFGYDVVREVLDRTIK